ncbi:MAG: hypothetical protein ACK55Z_27555 [bacterium]
MSSSRSDPITRRTDSPRRSGIPRRSLSSVPYFRKTMISFSFGFFFSTAASKRRLIVSNAFIMCLQVPSVLSR